MRFSAIFKPTSLFSLKDSDSTNSGAKSLFLPSPYAIKMALLNQAISLGDDLEKLKIKGSEEFGYIRDTKIMYHLPKEISFCKNNSFVKILKPSRNSKGFTRTVSFREYIYISHPIEIIFETKHEKAKSYLCKYIHLINYFGKRGCFFQFLEYRSSPSEPNVFPFEKKSLREGLLQKYDDFGKVDFENVNNFSTKKTKRVEMILTIPLEKKSSSKAYTHFQIIK